MSSAATEKVLLDTDIGTDVDDALTLAYLLMQPRCELLGVTTVTGDGERRAKLASVLCRVAGVDIPIYPGPEQTMLVEQREKYAPQADILAKWDHQSEFPRGQAVEFLRTTIRENPGEVWRSPSSDRRRPIREDLVNYKRETDAPL